MTLVFVGTYTHSTSKGIYAYNMDPTTGAHWSRPERPRG